MAGTIVDGVQIFEPKEEYRAHNSNPGYWGPVQSSIDWCEHNYVVSFYIAEFWNTLSNVFMIFFGLWGLYHSLRVGTERRFLSVYAGVLVIGIGSASFHGTLSHIGQQGDETPMLITILAWVYCLLTMDPAFEKAHPTLCKVYLRLGFLGCAVGFAVIHFYMRFIVVFQVTFITITLGALTLLLKEVGRCKNAEAKQVGKNYARAVLAGAIVWISDCLFCRQLYNLPFGLPNPQFHAWWHFLIGLSTYYGPCFLFYQRQYHLGRSPRLDWRWCGLMPVVEVDVAELRPSRNKTSEEKTGTVAPSPQRKSTPRRSSSSASRRKK